MGRQRSKSESGGGRARHFADFSLFPDRYDSGMNRSSTMNDGFNSGSSNRGQRSKLGSMPEEPQKRPHNMDSNFHKKQKVSE